jgi:uncharacterized protein with NAD-binding domain and iron-sulfur cluster
LIRRYGAAMVEKWTAAALPKMDGRTVVVTGANSGIGLAAARELGRAGAHVVLAVRDLEKGERAAAEVPGDREVRRLDLADLASVRAFAEAWSGGLDVLVNNAGVMAVPEGRTADGFELQFGTNHLAHFALTGLLVPALLELVTVVPRLLGGDGLSVEPFDQALRAVREELAITAEANESLRRSWHLVSVVTATLRGIVADGLLGDPRGFRRINDEDYRDWIGRHGAAPEALESTLVGGLYDLVFAHVDGDPGLTSFGAGWGVFLSGKTFFDYKGAIFWKMAAGMGDVVFAPLYEVLRRRGVEFAFLHRVDALHVGADRSTIDAVTVGLQARLADGRARYEPLVRIGGLPCFPAAPLTEQLVDADGIEDHALESHWCDWPDAERRVLRRGEDFDVAVLAIPVGMARVVCRELIDDRPEWRDMVEHVRTVATQSLQLWLREDEPTLGWPHPGVTMSGYVKPFDTWASMPQVLASEPWPPEERPRTAAYFCSTLAAPWPTAGRGAAFAEHQRRRVRENAVRFVTEDLAHLLPGVGAGTAFRWRLLCGNDGATGADAIDTQFYVANVDPSDRYVQSAAGTDRYRLRPDESGYDNLVLAGDWTDCGLNAGCIEAAVLSGLQAANAVLGRSRQHRIAGHYLL